MQTRKLEMKMRSNAATMLGSAVVALALAGCSASSFLPEPKADPTRFFVLATPGSDGRGDRAENAPTVQLRGVEVASYLKTRPMIVRHGANEVEFRDFARWGEPLEQGVARVLREALLAHGAGEVTLAGGRGGVAGADFELSVRVLACEGTADGGVDFRAAWELQPTKKDNGGAAKRGEYRATGESWDGRNEATLAAALSQAIAGLARDIGAAVAQ